jgi:YrbI family 3-deoxy-D-manno-octulosonate 8-phosphate phosphatase
MDFDGVFTDNRALIHEDGSESVFVSRGDGMGISKLRAVDFPMIVISTEQNPVVTARCNKLKIECSQGIDNKLPLFIEWVNNKGLEMSDVAYVGNDINDLECLEAAGVGIVPADAHPTALAIADHVLNAQGGHGAIREIADEVLRQLST